jgi:hypothetical protein
MMRTSKNGGGLTCVLAAYLSDCSICGNSEIFTPG